MRVASDTLALVSTGEALSNTLQACRACMPCVLHYLSGAGGCTCCELYSAGVTSLNKAHGGPS
jgi:H+/gluconate symporter-like permease